MDIEFYSEEVYKRVVKYCQAIPNRHEVLKYGYRILYGPPKHKPNIMVIGLQPGGKKAYPEDQQWPSKHDYLDADYPLALAMRDAFRKAGRLEELTSGIKTNVYFWRAPNSGEWQKIDRKIRRPLEDFSLRMVRDMISVYQPRLIFTEGLSVFKLIVGKSGKSQAVMGVTRRIGKVCELNEATVIGFLHPTGKWSKPTPSDWDVIMRLVQDKLDRIKTANNYQT